MHDIDTERTRRGVLRGAVAGAAAVATVGTAAAQSAFDGWLSDVSNYDGVHDMTGQSEVAVTVGAEGNGGNFAFGPAAIRVDPGTTVVWEWNGEGGSHNVVQEPEGTYESELVAEAGYTFSHTFESEGVSKYYCLPHRAVGMKGVVVVGEAAPDAPTPTPTPTPTATPEPAAGGDGGGGGGGGGGVGNGALLVGGGILGAFLSPVLFAVLLWLTRRRQTVEEADAEPGELTRVE
jgi:halocyanin-like protein